MGEQVRRGASNTADGAPAFLRAIQYAKTPGKRLLRKRIFENRWTAAGRRPHLVPENLAASSRCRREYDRPGESTRKTGIGTAIVLFWWTGVTGVR